MSIVIPPEYLLYLGIFMKNWIGQGLKNLEGKSLDEIKAIILDDQAMKSQLMAEMHSTD